MDKFIQKYHSVTTNKYAILLLVYFIHFKFFFQIVLDIESIVLDIALYVFLLLGINYKRIKYSFLILIPILGICILNAAARNIFVILLSTYIVSQLPLKTILFHNLSAQFIVFILASICLVLGITTSELFPQTVLDMRVRYDYGMGNPNTFALFIYSFIVNLYLYKGAYRKKYLFIIGVIAWFVFSYTGSRTFFMSVLMLLIFSALGNLWKRYPRISKFFLMLTPVLIFCAVFYFSRNYILFPEVNLLFSGRLDLYSRLLSAVNYSDYLIGTDLINTETIDSSFFHILFEGGIIPFSIFVLLYFNFVCKANRNQLSAIVPLLASIFTAALTESVLTFVLIFGNMIIWILLYKTYLNKEIPL